MSRKETPLKNSVTFNKMYLFFWKALKNPKWVYKNKWQKEKKLFYPWKKFCLNFKLLKHDITEIDASASKNLKESLSLYNTVRTHTACPNYEGAGETIIRLSIQDSLHGQMWTNT